MHEAGNAFVSGMKEEVSMTARNLSTPGDTVVVRAGDASAFGTSC